MQTDLKHIDALVLCGGLGKRLRPAVGETQKVMAQVAGRPFLDIVLKYIRKEGLRRAVLCAGYQGEEIRRHYQGKNDGLTIKVIIEKEPLGTGGAVKNAKTLVKSNPFFVFNGDSLCPVRLAEFLKFHSGHKALASVAVSRVKDAGDFGTVSLDGAGKITAFNEKQKKSAGFVNAGVYCFSEGVFGAMPKEKVFSIEKDFFPLLAGKEFYGFEAGGNFLDIGTPERYEEARRKLEKER